MLTLLFTPVLFIPLYAIHAINGPTIPIEKSLAPRVVNPPCASNIAWKSNTITPSTDVAAGPKSAAPNPLPQGCEQLPVTDGIFKDDNTNMNAPETASKDLDSGNSENTFLIFISPYTTTGIDSIYHTKHHIGGRNPSIMCIFNLSPLIKFLNFLVKKYKANNIFNNN